jgi:hypothetical protein
VGDTVGFELVLVNPAGLDVQEYVFPLTALEPRVVLSPKQMLFGGPTVAEGTGLTVTTTVSFLLQLVVPTVSVKM